ncbi:4-hydroxy-3-methylbut-2-enyl diphosphate reductase, chloroplastic-like [Primulina tabacum]|uniref:4-hydroxy-3-methylbut-2-enyl diphosphate reductase, chloroplastic-like n=1 Tax=Primulina tabacum TaxID=48773 RepID=UPI003F59C344
MAEETYVCDYILNGELDGSSSSKDAFLEHGELVEKENWLPDGPITIGVTSGASTPDKFAGCIKNQYYNQSQYDEVISEWSEFVYSYVGA